MAALERETSSMPAIKCSSCGEDILLAFMGSHTCSKGDEESTPPANTTPPQSTSTPPPEIAFLRPQRPPLPRIDINAGNRPGMFLGELTPASSRSSGLASPRSASSGQKSPWRIPPRKVSAPSVRRPPSPELTNLDCAFPPFPTSAAPRSKTPAYEKKGGRPQNQSAASTPRSSTFGPSSTKTKRTLSINSARIRNPSAMRPDGHSQPASTNTSRRPSISSAPGTRKGSVDDAPPLPMVVGLLPGTEEVGLTLLKRAETSPAIGQMPQHVDLYTTFSNQSESGPTRKANYDDLHSVETNEHITEATTQPSFDTSSVPPSPSGEGVKKQPSYKAKRPPPIDSGRSLPLLQRFKSILTPRTRAPTFPQPKSGPQSGFEKRPSDSAELPIFNQDSSTIKDNERIPVIASPEEISAEPEMMGSECSMQPPPRPARPDAEFDFALPNPTEDVSSQLSATSKLEDEFDFPFPNAALDSTTARPDPSDSAADIGTPIEDEPSISPAFRNETLFDVSSPASESTPKLEGVPELTEFSEPSNEISAAALHRSIDSSSSYYGSVTMSIHSTSSRSSLPPRDDATRTRSNTTHSGELAKLPSLDIHPTDLMASIAEAERSPIPESALDLAKEAEKPYLSDLIPLQPPRITEMQPDSPTEPLYQQGRLSPIPDQIDRHNTSHSRKPSSLSHRGALSRSKTVGPNKGTCRGCQNLIMANQKSVSSADGRLTGRYHKECFVCRTCKEAFTTADFYVLNDHPYCGPHYHELNGTTCGSCGQGIEGHYMETSTVAGKPNKKFHASCLACTTCRTPLREDYFEFNGRVYCEKDAFKLASLPSRSQYASAPARPSPLVRELVNSSTAGTNEGVEGVLGGRFPERRLTKLIEVGTNVAS